MNDANDPVNAGNPPADDSPGSGHYVNRAGWLRAAVLGANDGLLSTGSLMAGVAAAAVAPGQLVLTGVAGIVAGALSMAAGEYVSVSSQSDSEKADLDREQQALRDHPKRELKELTAIYHDRGLDHPLAATVAQQLTETNALDAHARDELGITDMTTAKPLQAALASACSFVVGGIGPLAMALLFPGVHVLIAIAIVTVITLAILGALGARIGGAPVVPGVTRVVLLGSLALALTAGVGHFFHATG
jgi:VIT1/CCC1 family predicted Fe2+/Mn2+ transporter